MIKRMNLFRGRLALVALASAAVALAVTVTPASAVSEAVSGKFQTNVVFGEECQAASAQICAVGSTSGKLKGAFTFGVADLMQTADTPQTSVIRFSGEATVDTKTGTLTCTNAAALQTTGDGAFVSLCVVSSGTGEWAGATGYLQVHGTFTFDGGATGQYVGRIVRG